jgi:hypothetical protein
MKIISHILAMFLSGMKSEDVYLELTLTIVALKAEWILLIALFSLVVKTFRCTHAWPGNQVSHRLALCYEV